MARIQQMRSLAFEVVPENLKKMQEFCQKLAKIIENLNFAFWKKSVLELYLTAMIKPG